MDRSDVIKLITTTKTQDSRGVWRKSYTPTQVFVQVDSISMSEFYEAGRNGLNPAFRFRMFQGDYNGEESCEYKGLPYSIYRTYMRDDDTIELYVQREGGTNGQETDNS